MNPKKFFHYFLLPMLAILLIPYWIEGKNSDHIQIVFAIISGVLLGSIRCFWDRHQYRKEGH